ncbi:hypothetical protein BY458DRAFT_551381 [Sporodiniella umbellata]|nr:hypothetical protein BY458DRAFT_551381 [Sporodiniella umbellata]
MNAVMKPKALKGSLSAPLIPSKGKEFPKTSPWKKSSHPLLDEDDEPLTQPITLAEKRARQAKRAYQIKIWRVREERDAREARSLLRKKQTHINPPAANKKGVRFNLKKNRIIQIKTNEENKSE